MRAEPHREFAMPALLPAMLLLLLHPPYSRGCVVTVISALLLLLLPHPPYTRGCVVTVISALLLLSEYSAGP